MIKYRKANDEEKTVILNSLNQARKEKRWEIIKNAVPYVIFVVFVGWDYSYEQGHYGAEI